MQRADRPGYSKDQKKGKQKEKATMTQPDLQTPKCNPMVTPRASKRRRLGEEQAAGAVPSQVAHERELEQICDTKYYDPDQKIEERRVVRKGIRDLARNMNGGS